MLHVVQNSSTGVVTDAQQGLHGRHQGMQVTVGDSLAIRKRIKHVLQHPLHHVTANLEPPLHEHKCCTAQEPPSDGLARQKTRMTVSILMNEEAV